ncbi:MAG: hypothetical protein EOO38_30990 [Cytophagaceae bacterium]|jgi:hypothetical protein|nr:hypothetical protein [uncultured Noviherbaspirillum sp.]RYF32436.1 MAG: hypothetical protein EOO38_30990 [Cytophagaceae bacterium]
MASRPKRKYSLSVDSFLAAGRTAGALLLGNAALIVTNDLNHWANALKVVSLGLILITMCSIDTTEVSAESGTDNDQQEKS